MCESSLVVAEKFHDTIDVQSRSMKLYFVYAVVLMLNTFCRTSNGDEKTLGTFFQTHCVICHDATTQEGGFRVDGNGLQIAHKALMFQWQSGKKVIVWPEELTSAAPRFPTPEWSKRP